MANPAILNYVDENGTLTKSVMHVPEATVDPADLADLGAALQGCSAAKLSKIGILNDLVFLGTLGTGAYDAEDKMILSFEDDQARIMHVTVPAPKGTCFMADDKTVDPEAANVDSLISEILIAIITAGGAALVRFVKGWRARRNRKA